MQAISSFTFMCNTTQTISFMCLTYTHTFYTSFLFNTRPNVNYTLLKIHTKTTQEQVALNKHSCIRPGEASLYSANSALTAIKQPQWID